MCGGIEVIEDGAVEEEEVVEACPLDGATLPLLPMTLPFVVVSSKLEGCEEATTDDMLNTVDSQVLLALSSCLSTTGYSKRVG